MGFLIIIFLFIGNVFSIEICPKSQKIIDIENKRFSNIPKIELTNINFNKYSSVSYSIYKKDNQYHVLFKTSCTKAGFSLNLIRPSLLNNEIYDFLIQKLTVNNNISESELKSYIKSFLVSRGYFNPFILIDKTKIKNNFIYNLNLQLKNVNIINKIVFKDLLIDNLSKIINTKYSNIISSQENIVKIINSINDFLLNNKFNVYNLEYNLEKTVKSSILYVQLKDVKRLFFHIDSGNRYVDKLIIKNSLYENIKTVEDLKVKNIKRIIRSLYRSYGWKFLKIKVALKEDPRNIKNFINFNKYIYISIKNGQRIRTDRIEYLNSFNMKSKLEKLFDEKCTSHVCSGYWDQLFFKNYKKEIKGLLFQNGYVYSQVKDPTFKLRKNKVNVTYDISLNKKVVINSIKLLNGSVKKLPNDLVLINKVGSPININEIKNDYQKVLNYFKKNGYIFASVDPDKSKIINYNNDSAEIIFPVILGQKYFLNRIIFKNILKTKSKVILRELKYDKGTLITSDLLSEIRNSLLLLGLFSSVNIKVVRQKNKTINKSFANIAISLMERKFGIAEIKPGFRTDSGFRLSSKVSYNNLFYLHHQASIQANINKRISNDGLSSDRLSLRNNFLEFDFDFIYRIPYIISNISLTSTLTRKKEMFYSFDARITKLSELFNKKINKNFELYSSYKFENIEQFYASKLSDNDTFKIGSITLGLVFDYRDRSIFPRKGYWSNFSWEYSHPVLGSIQNKKGEINFNRFILQNRFYNTLFNNVFAFSLNIGFEYNLSTSAIETTPGIFQSKGYIPSLKVFRLSGLNAVRGYLEQEVNLINTKDISEYRIDKSVSFLSGKLEYRIPYTENIYFGPFYDFGAIFIDKFEIKNLKHSIGSFIKFLTPVGTIDISYGIKLHRINNQQIKESFGEFDLLIGFF